MSDEVSLTPLSQLTPGVLALKGVVDVFPEEPSEQPQNVDYQEELQFHVETEVAAGGPFY